jgi:tetratricopeptide (TPR) repeat protein
MLCIGRTKCSNRETMLYAALLCLAIHTADQSALQAGPKEVATRQSEAGTKSTPQSAQGYFDQGVAYMRAGDYGSAIPPLKKALELNPDLAAAHQPLGYSLLAQGYATEAIAQFDVIQDKAGLGIAQLQTGDLPDAVQNLQSAVSARPDDPDLVYYLARASGLLSKQLYDSLLASHPGSARANQAFADNYAAVRQTSQAEAYYLKVIKERPDLPGVHLALGEMYAGTNQWKPAEEAFRAEAKLQPGSAEAAYRLGYALLQDGNTREARLELSRADRLQPDMPETLYALGKAESSETNYSAAEKAWNRVIELEKTGPLASQAHFGLATIYRKQGKTEDAAREMKLFEESRPAEKQ